jgi:hypothetical protein
MRDYEEEGARPPALQVIVLVSFEFSAVVNRVFALDWFMA